MLQEAVATAVREYREERARLREEIAKKDEMIHDLLERIDELEVCIIQMGGRVPEGGEIAADVLDGDQ